MQPTKSQELHEQAMIDFAKEPRNIIHLLLTAHIEFAFFELIKGYHLTANLTPKQLTHFVLFYALKDSDLRKAFCNLMPFSFFTKVEKYSQEKAKESAVVEFEKLSKDTAPSIKLCGILAEVLNNYPGMNSLCHTLLAHLSKSFPEIKKNITISDKPC